MKRTGKLMTLSGQMPKRLFDEPLFRNPHTVLEYSNVLDINRAWRVLDFRCWIQEDVSDLGFTEAGLLSFDVQLNTDEILNPVAFNNAGDNRAVGFGNMLYSVSDGMYKPGFAFTGGTRGIMNQEYFIHPDRIVQNKLILCATGDGAQALTENKPGYTMNYMIYLEEVDITPTESIVYNIKSKAQDIS